MASLRRFLEQKEKTKPEPISPQPLEKYEQPIVEVRTEIQQIPEQTIVQPSNPFISKSEAEETTPKNVEVPSKSKDEWETIETKSPAKIPYVKKPYEKKPKPQLRNLPRKSEEVKTNQRKSLDTPPTSRYRPKQKAPEPESGENTGRNSDASDITLEVSRKSEKSQVETSSPDKIEETDEFETINFQIKLAPQAEEKPQEAPLIIPQPVEVVDKPAENKSYSVFDEKQAEEFTGKFASRTEFERITADMENKKTQTPITTTREVGVQVTFEGGIPCMIVPIQDRDFFRIENLIYPRR